MPLFLGLLAVLVVVPSRACSRLAALAQLFHLVEERPHRFSELK